MIKKNKQIGYEKIILNIIKEIYEKPFVSTIPDGKNWRQLY